MSVRQNNNDLGGSSPNTPNNQPHHEHEDWHANGREERTHHVDGHDEPDHDPLHDATMDRHLLGRDECSSGPVTEEEFLSTYVKYSVNPAKKEKHLAPLPAAEKFKQLHQRPSAAATDDDDGTRGPHPTRSPRPASPHHVRVVMEIDDGADLDQGAFPRYLASIKRSLNSLQAPSRRTVAKKSWRAVTGFFPILDWLPKYNFKQNALGDVTAGVILGILYVTQGLAYGRVAGLTATSGLYSCIVPVAVGTAMTTVRHNAIGPFALLSLMINSAVYSLAKDTSNISELLGITYVLTFMVGVFQFGMGALRMGMLMSFLSDPLIAAFTAASAFQISSGQLKYVFGVKVPSSDGIGGFFLNVYNVLAALPSTNIAALVVSIISTIILLASKHVSEKYAKRLRGIPIPGELIVVVLTTLVSALAHLHDRFKLDILGPIPSGFPPVAVPDFSAHLTGALVARAFPIAIIGIVITISIGKTYGPAFGYAPDDNQEFLMLGTTNMAGSFFSAFAASGSLSRSTVFVSVGGKTGVAPMIAFVIVLIVVAWLAPLFEHLPTASLACIIITAFFKIFLKVTEPIRLWHIKRADSFVWTMTFVGVLVLGVELGVAVGLGSALVTLIFPLARPYSTRLARVPDTVDLYRDIRRYPGFPELHGIRIFRFESSLCFANVEYFRHMLYRLTADPTKRPNSCSSTECGWETWPGMHSVIVVASSFNEIDADGVKMLVRVTKEFNRVGVKVIFAGCQGRVRKVLNAGGFYESVGAKQMFVTLHDAVVFAEQHGAELWENRHKPSSIVVENSSGGDRPGDGHSGSHNGGRGDGSTEDHVFGEKGNVVPPDCLSAIPLRSNVVEMGILPPKSAIATSSKDASPTHSSISGAALASAIERPGTSTSMSADTR